MPTREYTLRIEATPTELDMLRGSLKWPITVISDQTIRVRLKTTELDMLREALQWWRITVLPEEY